MWFGRVGGGGGGGGLLRRGFRQKGFRNDIFAPDFTNNLQGFAYGLKVYLFNIVKDSEAKKAAVAHRYSCEEAREKGWIMSGRMFNPRTVQLDRSVHQYKCKDLIKSQSWHFPQTH